MQQDQVRRGLAASAVAALAVAGLSITATPAHAADGDDVRMLSQLNGKASTRYNLVDLLDSGTPGIELVAERLDPDATIAFEYNTDPGAADDAGGWTPIGAPSAPPSRFVEAQWTAPDLAGSSVALRAVATTDATTTYSTLRDVEITGVDSPVNSVGLNMSDGYFVQPYADSQRTATLIEVEGFTSATEGTVELAWWRSSDGSFQGQTDAAVESFETKLGPGGPLFTGGAFETALDITGYDAEAFDALAVRALHDTDAVAVAEPAYAQEVGSVQVGAQETTSTGTPLLLTVNDQLASGIAGAEVRRGSDGSLVGYTNPSGMVQVLQPNETTETYYVNTTDTDAFEAGTDVASEPLVAPAYVPVPSATELVLADGDVFDDDEYAEGDIVLQVVDQEGTPLAAEGEMFSYALHPSGEETPELTPVTSDADGRVVVPFETSGPDGDYTVTHTPPEGQGGDWATTTFVAGDATLSLAPAKGSAASGRTITYVGRLAVGDRPLTGRQVDLSYTRGVERTPGRKADAGILEGDQRRLSGRVTTGADGSFRVKVDDPREQGRPTERGGQLRATAVAANEQVTVTTAFGVVLKLRGTSNRGGPDRLSVKAPASMAGERVQVFKKARPGAWKLVRKARLGRDGSARVKVADRNGRRFTRYLVKLVPSTNAVRSRSNGTRLR